MPDTSPPAQRRPWRTAFLLAAALTIAAQLAGLAWLAQGQVERGRALQGGGAVTRLISSDPCLDYRIAAPAGPGPRCDSPRAKSVAEAR